MWGDTNETIPIDTYIHIYIYIYIFHLFMYLKNYREPTSMMALAVGRRLPASNSTEGLCNASAASHGFWPLNCRSLKLQVP